ncbi:MAG: family 16 glycoside hydrolase, partial [Patescibacteria group bacterium]|nr:family 16 glycoside hydrolase [Patescibacteria group bacterium]
GRWMSEDPIGFEGKDGNLYAYVGNGPGNAVDPAGLAVYTGWQESGRRHWLNPGNWRVEGDVWTSGVDANGNPILGDHVWLYAHTVGAFKEYFTITFDFKFASGYVQSPGKDDRAGFVANSGVYIYNAIEVNIIDTNAILEYLDEVTKDGRVHISRPPYVDETKWKRWKDGERFWGMLTGVPYGKPYEGRDMEGWYERGSGWLEWLNPLKGAGEWNTMEIRFDPTFKNGVLLSYTLKVYVNGRLTHYGTHTTPTKDQGNLPMDEIQDYRIFLQTHHGSQVSFRNMVIKTGTDAPGMGDGPTRL